MNRLNSLCPTRDLSVLSLSKGAEWYCFVYDDAHRNELIWNMMKMASNPDLSFSWSDAVFMKFKMELTSSKETQT